MRIIGILGLLEDPIPPPDPRGGPDQLEPLELLGPLPDIIDILPLPEPDTLPIGPLGLIGLPIIGGLGGGPDP